MAPPRFKPCPACAKPCPVQASSCADCGHVWPRRKGGRPAPSFEARYASALARRAHIDQGKRGPAPAVIPPRNISAKGQIVLAEIRRLTKAGICSGDIAHIIGQSKTSVRRYAKDYGVKLILSEPGPMINGATALKASLLLLEVRAFIPFTTNVAEIAETLGVSQATVREKLKRCRDVYGIELPGFDHRSRTRKRTKTAVCPRLFYLSNGFGPNVLLIEWLSI